MSFLMEILKDQGPVVAMLAYMTWANNGLVKKMFTVIESNTKAFMELKNVVENVPHNEREKVHA